MLSDGEADAGYNDEFAGLLSVSRSQLPYCVFLRGPLSVTDCPQTQNAATSR